MVTFLQRPLDQTNNPLRARALKETRKEEGEAAINKVPVLETYQIPLPVVGAVLLYLHLASLECLTAMVIGYN